MDRREEQLLEEQLKDALRPLDAPPGFAARVLARAATEQAPVRRRFWSWPILRWAVAAIVIVAVSVGALEYRREQRERAEGQAARQQAIVAFRIAGSKLKLAEAKVQRISTRDAHAVRQ